MGALCFAARSMFVAMVDSDALMPSLIALRNALPCCAGVFIEARVGRQTVACQGLISTDRDSGFMETISNKPTDKYSPCLACVRACALADASERSEEGGSPPEA